MMHTLFPSREFAKSVEESCLVLGPATMTPIRATPTDAPEIFAVFERSFLEYARGMGSDRPRRLKDLPERLSAGEVHVVRAPSGALWGALIWWHDPIEGALHIDVVAVDPAAQGQGVGRALLAEADRLARSLGYNKVRLYTLAMYDHLVAYYQSAGFELTHTGPRPSDPDAFDRAFMVKHLDASDA